MICVLTPLFLCCSLTLSVYAAVIRSRSHIHRNYCPQVFPSIIVTSNAVDSLPSTRKDTKLFYYKREYENRDENPSYKSKSNGSPKQTLKRKKLQESDDRSLLEQMRKSLGDTEDVFEGAESESKQLLQGLVRMVV